MKRITTPLIVLLTVISLVLGAGLGTGLRDVVSGRSPAGVLFLAPEAAPVRQQSSLVPDDLALSLIARLASSSVVSVVGDLPDSDQRTVGSGFFISPAGLVVTSRHVVDSPGNSYLVITADQQTFKVTKILKSADNDVALLRTTAVNTPWLTLDAAQRVKSGQPVAVIGAGADRVMSVGTVANTGRTVTAKGTEFAPGVVQKDAIQINAVIRPGNSGGPLLDSSGQVVGIVFAWRPDAQSIGFALPTATVKGLVEQLLQEEYPATG